MMHGNHVNRIDVLNRNACRCRGRERETAAETRFAYRVLFERLRKIDRACCLEFTLQRAFLLVALHDAQGSYLIFCHLPNKRCFREHYGSEHIRSKPFVYLTKITQVCGNDLHVAARVEQLLFGQRGFGRAYEIVIPVAERLRESARLTHSGKAVLFKVEGIPKPKDRFAVFEQIDRVSVCRACSVRAHLVTRRKHFKKRLQVEHKVVRANHGNETFSAFRYPLDVLQRFVLVTVERHFVGHIRFVFIDRRARKIVEYEQNGICACIHADAYIACFRIVCRTYAIFRFLFFHGYSDFTLMFLTTSYFIALGESI